MAREKRRCDWVDIEDRLYLAYHDEEWGVPVHEDKRIFEFLVLEAAQAGLSWRTVLHKRDSFRRAFDGFDPKVVARYDEDKVKRLLADPGIIRNEQKIRAAVKNAGAFLKVQKEFGSFDSYVWKFVGGLPKTNRWKQLRQIPAFTDESARLSGDLARRGFSFVGPTICYSHMQATGMVNDHLTYCFRHSEV